MGVLASPITGLVRGLGSMIQGLALQLEQIREQGLVAGGDSEAGEQPAPDESADVDEAEEEGRAAAAEEDAPQSADEEETSGEAGEEEPADASDEQSDASEEAEAKED